MGSEQCTNMINYRHYMFFGKQVSPLYHCPYCGSKINDDELFCTQCGKKLPHDLDDRFSKEKINFRVWLVPIISFVLILAFIGGFYLFLQEQTANAKEMFAKGEELALEGEYSRAESAFKEALVHKNNFPAASTNKAFMAIASSIEALLKKASDYAQKNEYQQALTTIKDAESKLINYNGEAVNLLVEDISTYRNKIKLNHLKFQMEKDLSVEELKPLLWQAESINNDDADIIAKGIRERIVSFAFSTASEQLKKKHFSNARDIVDDALKYAPESEKLTSLKTTVEKEKASFETAQQKRIEQAMNAAEQEQQLNKNDAVKLLEVNVAKNEQNETVVKGKIKSLATVPINSISITYQLLNSDGGEIASNEVYTYPDTLYPEEEGQFEYTHYDVSKELKDLKVKVKTIKWFLD